MKYIPLTSPFLFSFAFLAFALHDVSHIAPPGQLLRPLFYLWILLFLLALLIYRLTSKWETTGFLLLIFVFGFCVSTQFLELAGSLLVIAFVVWQIYFRLRGYKIALGQFTSLAALIGLGFVFYALYINIVPLARVPWRLYYRSVEEARHPSLRSSRPVDRKPDIYYIVLDDYARSDILRELYGYDNSGFVEYLQQKGFIVPEHEHSNYIKTVLSVSSMLNLNYQDSFAPGLENAYFWWLLEPFIDHSAVRSFLQSLGYTTVSVSTNWSLTDNPTTDLYLHPFPLILSDFEQYLLQITPLSVLKPMIRNFASVPTFETHRRIVNAAFESIEELPALPGPKFVFVHIISPHPPFIFDEMGNPIDPKSSFGFSDASDFYGTKEEYRRSYVAQLQFVNGKLRTTIDAILKNSKTSPIIILQADHGSGMYVDFNSSADTCLKERFSPFSAYYLPGVDPAVIPDTITPVNLFRIIFDQYFSTGLPLLENKQYFSSGIPIYRLEDVTSRVGTCTMP